MSAVYNRQGAGAGSRKWRGEPLKAQLSSKDIIAIEKALSQCGAPEVVVKIENGKVVVLQVSKKKIV